MYVLFFFTHTATTEIYTLSLHDALPIYGVHSVVRELTFNHDALVDVGLNIWRWTCKYPTKNLEDRKSTRLNSSHPSISYAVFCLKKKKKKYIIIYHILNHLTNITQYIKH